MKKEVTNTSSFNIKFTGKHLFQRLFHEVGGLRLATLLKKRLWHRCFPVYFAKFLRTPFLQNTFGWLLLTFNRYANLKNLYWWCHSIASFPILKKSCSIVNKRLPPMFSPFFTVVSFFTKRWVVQKLEPKGSSIELSMFSKYGLTEVKKAPL